MSEQITMIQPSSVTGPQHHSAAFVPVLLRVVIMFSSKRALATMGLATDGYTNS